MGVDFAANASSKAIKESVDLSAAITNVTGVTSSGTTIAADGRSVTFAYNGTYTENKISGTSCTTGNNVGMNGSMQTVNLVPGLYFFEAWGGEGGKGCHGATGGKGGYVSGYYKVTGTSTVRIYVAVGGKGSDNYRNQVTASSAYERGQAKGGGYNGGGGVFSTGSGCGGGATHIALSNHGELKNYKTYSTWTKNMNQFEPTNVTADYSGDVLMVAGGGGGAEHGLANVGTGNGGGLTGAEGRYFTSGGWNNNNACHGLGGGQTAGGGHRNGTTTSHVHNYTTASNPSSTWNTHPSNGYFGQGGAGTGEDWGGGGGGGGWYGGGGSYVYGGGGGSSYTKATVVTDVTHTQGAREGHGAAKITLISSLATQTSIPTITLNRHESKTFAYKGTSESDSLLGSHPYNLALSADVNKIYQVDGLADSTTQDTLMKRTFTDAEKADTAVNSWLSYSFTTDGVTLKATRYWTGTKAFYVKVKDTTDAPYWFKFYATVEGGELKKDQTLCELRIQN